MLLGHLLPAVLGRQQELHDRRIVEHGGEGVRVLVTPNRFISITMTTDALSDLFDKFDTATHLDVVTSTARVPFKLGGFAGALEQLRSCAQRA